MADPSGTGNLLTIRNGDGRGRWPDLSRLQTWLMPVVAPIPKGPFEKVIGDSAPSSAVVLSAASVTPRSTTAPKQDTEHVRHEQPPRFRRHAVQSVVVTSRALPRPGREVSLCPRCPCCVSYPHVSPLEYHIDRLVYRGACVQVTLVVLITAPTRGSSWVGNSDLPGRSQPVPLCVEGVYGPALSTRRVCFCPCFQASTGGLGRVPRG